MRINPHIQSCTTKVENLHQNMVLYNRDPILYNVLIHRCDILMAEVVKRKDEVDKCLHGRVISNDLQKKKGIM